MASKLSSTAAIAKSTMLGNKSGTRGTAPKKGDKTTKITNQNAATAEDKQKIDATLLESGWVCCQEPCHCMDETATTKTTCQPTGDGCGHSKCTDCWLVRILPQDMLDAMNHILNRSSLTEHGWFCEACKRHFLDIHSDKDCTSCGSVTEWAGTCRVTTLSE
ncbi:hypothetical protein HBI56_128060 [Parastagonospora nodorum]|uniref:Uncharacterized protein n=1 Tax=Phaeosphaeria nodorum (strain SN15 / ATCC MYA-4574 / FGSC 10173) TaxID=321614 RepID=A0A7U2HYZ1_PHANO|nr:hypothetical protein HBH56_155770 [Parastagonospora nodorum]QRC95833.1 hypothetical protein JI435_432800 [Parastagonospora nodorum SN15]KAH3926817.1 hypothetical protein HBH54_161900 [Parastagonospora nodorum]KAH3943307.1 hypothetical protein HBH53_177260 [Parastagonospora nodorum]KAH3970228.1 hypothetical protein HBH52_168960 [Parastagonospora nodorum]